MENKHLPTFLFVGTAKAGTTSIYNYLKQHPNISIPVKETFFFMQDIYKNIHLPYPQQRADEPLFKDEKEYLNIYNNQSEITGEIGTGYLYYYKEAGPLIKKYLGDEVKILLILRNPIERAFSSFKHFTKDLFEVDTFEQALELEDERIKNEWDFMWHHKKLGLYYEQVKYYLENFKHVKVLFYDDLIKDPIKMMDEIILFIGIKESFEFKTEAVFNESGTPKNKWLHKIIVHDNFLKKYITRPLLKTFFPYALRDKIRKYVRNKNFKKSELKMSPETRKKLIEYYRSDIEKLSNIVNRDLSHWLKG